MYLLLWIENLSSDDVNSYISTVCELYYAIYMVPMTFVVINVIFVCVGHLCVEIQKKIKFCMVTLPCTWILAHGKVTILTFPVQNFAVC